MGRVDPVVAVHVGARRAHRARVSVEDPAVRRAGPPVDVRVVGGAAHAGRVGVADGGEEQRPCTVTAVGDGHAPVAGRVPGPHAQRVRCPRPGRARRSSRTGSYGPVPVTVIAVRVARARGPSRGTTRRAIGAVAGVGRRRRSGSPMPAPRRRVRALPRHPLTVGRHLVDHEQVPWLTWPPSCRRRPWRGRGWCACRCSAPRRWPAGCRRTRPRRSLNTPSPAISGMPDPGGSDGVDEDLGRP